MECMGALRAQVQTDLILTGINRKLTREIQNDAICGA